MDLSDKNEREKRAALIQAFSSVEYLVNAFICFHYFNNNEHLDFLNNVLENEYFNSHLRLKVFYNLLENKGLKFPQEALNRMQKLRNISAHRPEYQGTAKNSDGSVSEKGEPFYFHQGKPIPITQLHAEFFELHDAVIEALNGLPGVKYQTVEPNKMTPEDVDKLTKRFKRKES